MVKAKYNNVLLKLSGEALMGDTGYGIDPNALSYLAEELFQVKSNFDLKISIVVGGGNIWRGADYEEQGMDRSVADSAGMLGTMINGLAIQDSLERRGVPVRTLSALSTPSVAEPFIRRRALRHLDKGRVVILAGGTGNPYMTTDTAAAQRSLELNSELLIMSKNNVDGVYTSDPNKNDDAKKFDHLTPIEALAKRIQALDSTALSLCMDNDLPIIVFDIFNNGSLEKILLGEKVGTLISYPILPLRNTVLFPHQVIPVYIGREQSLNLIDSLPKQGKKYIVVIAQKDGSVENPSKTDLYEGGTLAIVMKIFDMPDNSKSAIVQGVDRVRLIDIQQKKPLLIVCKQGKEYVPNWMYGVMPHQHMFSDWLQLIDYLGQVHVGANPNHYKRWRFFDFERVYGK